MTSTAVLTVIEIGVGVITRDHRYLTGMLPPALFEAQVMLLAFECPTLGGSQRHGVTVELTGLGGAGLSIDRGTPQPHEPPEVEVQMRTTVLSRWT